jgi:F-type H+-transporting ATPase subunit epsilon
MNFKLITLLGVKLDEDVYEVNIPTSSGEIGVFPGHEPLVTVAVPGVISVRRNKDDSDDERELFAISDGVVQIEQDSIRILVDEADGDNEIVEDDVKAALERALELRDNAEDQVELNKALEMIDRQTVRLKVAELRRRKRH